MCAGVQYRDCSQELEAGRESRNAPIDGNGLLRSFCLSNLTHNLSVVIFLFLLAVCAVGIS